MLMLKYHVAILHPATGMTGYRRGAFNPLQVAAVFEGEDGQAILDMAGSKGDFIILQEKYDEVLAAIEIADPSRFTLPGRG